ncbi:unnamed protein product [Rhodiola kirilowii]
MSIISWNCRGVGGPRAVRSLCDVVNSYRPSILGLIETKKADGDWELLRYKLGFRGCFSVSSQGRSGGLALLWGEDFDVTLVNYSSNHIDVEVKGTSTFYLSLFYGEPRTQDRIHSWSLLRRLRRDQVIPWVVIGDFNEIAYSREYAGRRTRQPWQMRQFRRCLEDCGLMDLGYKGDTFTFSNKRRGELEVKARLDRVVANQGWRDSFPHALVKHGFANSSDHIPIILCLAGAKIRKRCNLERFEPMWLRHGDFKGLVKDVWRAQPGDSSLMEKLQNCMTSLKQWGAAEFGNVKEKVKNLKERLQELRKCPRSDNVVSDELRCSNELDEWMEREELYWRQRSRAEWLKHGDRNTSYFHAKASQRKKRNHIDCLRDSTGVLQESDSQIASIITDYFINIFKSQVVPQGARWNHEFQHVPKMVSDDMNRQLLAPFTEGEIKRALFQMHPTKAPGLDGYSALFYQTNWDVVSRDIIREVLMCLNNEVINPTLNATLIVLVPKVQKVEKVEQLRPISLCNVVMKIVTKVLANRLKDILPHIISQSQSAFIGGRLITDNILIAHEVSHFIKGATKQKTGFMSVKLDMSKAYDRIEWRFLEKMMLAMGFDDGWVRKVMVCVKTVTYRVKINDNFSGVIKPERGLRQGDPISPYLFLLCAEWLTFTINKYHERGLVKGIRISRTAPVITHLMFADDCMLFLKAKPDCVCRLQEILRRYEAVSGQKVNYEKSQVVCSRNVPDLLKNEIVESLGVKVVEVHSNYLGLPLIFGNRKTALFRLIEEKVHKKTEDWKHKLLSAAGREVLIKSVLQSIPAYAMSAFKIPATVCRQLATEVLKFWWHSKKLRGIHWVKSDILFKEKVYGGLGFRNFRLMNMALLAKQAWRIMMEPNLLISRLLKAKYFPESDMFNATTGARPSYAWRGIQEALFIVKFGAVWDEYNNKYFWSKDSSGQLTVKGAYLSVMEIDKMRNPPEGEQSDLSGVKRFWRSLWKLQIPNKIKMFGWRLFYDSLPTKQNLSRKGCEVDNRCCHCGFRGETAIHIFKSCWWIRGLLFTIGLPEIVWDNLCDAPGYWLWLCLKVCTEEQFTWLLCGLWLCWKDRNDIEHGKEGNSLANLSLRLNFMMHELKVRGKDLLMWRGTDHSGLKRPLILCDGSFDPKTKVAGCGIVLWMDGKVERAKAGWDVNCSSALEAECEAILLGMSLARELSLTEVQFLTDSREALWAITLGSWRSDCNMGVIRHCIADLDNNQGWLVDSISREDNNAADWLAKKARIEKWSWTVSSAIPLGLPKVL